MVSADEALRLVLDSVKTLAVERVGLREAHGRVLADEIRSPRDIPGFDNSAMDGFAVLFADVSGASESNPVKLRVIETIAAGKMPNAPVVAGTASRIMTGAPLPSGADAIIPVEQTRGSSDTVEILAIEPGRNFIRPRGEDLRVGQQVLSPGQRLSAADIGLLASLNRSVVDVYRRVRVAIVSTGDELVDVDQIPTGAQVVNSSAYALSAGVESAGGEATVLRVARDTEREVTERLSEALSFDVVLTTGGVSVGQFDHVKVVMDQLGLKQLFHGVAQKPGRPLKFGLIEDRPVFGLPGNPVSTLVCFYLYAYPALLKMMGRGEIGLPRVTVKCAADIKLAKNLTEFVRVSIENRNGERVAMPTGNQGSGILSSMSRADGLLIGPASQDLLKAGAQATVLLLATEAAGDSTAFFEERHRRH